MAKSKSTKGSAPSKKTTKSSKSTPAKKPAAPASSKAKPTVAKPSKPATAAAAKKSAPPAAASKPATRPTTKAPAAKPSKPETRVAKPPARIVPGVTTKNRSGSQAVQQQPAQPPKQPMNTSDKPKKNQAGLGARDLEHFRELLLGKRRELLGDMSSMEREALRSTTGSNLSNLPVHMADMGTDNYEQEFTLGLVEKDRVLLREINHALAKIQDGTYGICEGTGLPIGKPRLEAKPWARHSIEYARKIEMGLVRL